MMRTFKKFNFSVFVTLFWGAIVSCSSGEKKEKPSPELSAQAGSEPSKDEKSSEPEKKKDEESSQKLGLGESVYVVTNLAPSSGIQGSVGNQVVSEAIVGFEELLRRAPENSSVVTTFLALTRLGGQGSDVYRTLGKAAGSAGNKNPWMFIEAAYGAALRKEFGLVEYLLGKASKVAGGDANAKAAISHAYGIRYLLDKRQADAIFEMRKATNHLPSLLTLGFMGLKAGDYVGAERQFRLALALDENNLNSKIGLAAALRAKGRADEALPLILQVMKARKDDRRAVWNYALTLSEVPGRSAEAVSELTRYFQLAGSLGDIDTKANNLMQKLQTEAAAAKVLGAPKPVAPSGGEATPKPPAK
jgi:tetratricopeptide (TPR) repeat protein